MKKLKDELTYWSIYIFLLILFIIINKFLIIITQFFVGFFLSFIIIFIINYRFLIKFKLKIINSFKEKKNIYALNLTKGTFLSFLIKNPSLSKEQLANNIIEEFLGITKEGLKWAFCLFYRALDHFEGDKSLFKNVAKILDLKDQSGNKNLRSLLHEKEFFSYTSDVISPIKSKIYTTDKPMKYITPDGFFIRDIKKDFKALDSKIDFNTDDNNFFIDLKGCSRLIQNKSFTMERFVSNETVSYNIIYDFFKKLEVLNESSYYIPPKVYIYCPLRRKIFRNIYQEGNINFTENYFQEVSLNAAKSVIKILTHNI